MSDAMAADNGPQRVVSLLGAATETIYRLGVGHRLVGRSHECDWPPIVLSLPMVSRPRLDVTARAEEIDAAVRQHAANGEPIYELDDEQLSELAPDLLIVQDQCRVCAIMADDVDRSSCSGLAQLVLKPFTLADSLGDILSVADALGVHERGVKLHATLESRLNRVRELANSANGEHTPPRVALLEWCSPIMGNGYWLPELVQVAGGQAIHNAPPGGQTPTITFEQLLDSTPDVVIFALCGFDLARSAAEVQTAWGDDAVAKLSDKCAGKLFVVDGNYLVNRSGPRLVESAEALAEAIHPCLQGHFGHYGTNYLTTFSAAPAFTGSTKQRPKASPKVPPHLDVEKPAIDPAQVVSDQLSLLAAGNVTGAFALNSRANQDRWCGADRFETVLRGHGDFARLLQQDGGAEVVASEIGEGSASVRVTLPELAACKAVYLVWTMVTEVHSNGRFVWRTEKVGIA